MVLIQKLFWALVIVVSAAKSLIIEPVSTCPSSDQSVFILQHNTTVGVRLRSFPANFDECSDHCANSADCFGVEFSSAECAQCLPTCKLFGSGAEPSIAGSQILVKNCVQSDHVCSSPFHFEVFEQKILVGFAREVVKTEKIQVCMAACLNSFDTFGFECMSFMFYPKDKECILNTDDRLNRPDLFMDEDEDIVIYADNNCAGSQCHAQNITQYIAVDGKQLENELDRIIVVDFDSCQSLCTQRRSLTNAFNCKSFMYNNQTRTCILSDERSIPSGRSKLVPNEGFTYYEKKCFAPLNACRNITRFPEMILVGWAAYVLENVPTVTMCLEQCIKPPPETDGFVCKSALYLYKHQECVLNAASRTTKPDLFRDDSGDHADYFDINCDLQKEKRDAHSL